MSNGFYKYIADNTIKYFLQNSESIRPGERFSLILDNDELAQGVVLALQEKTLADSMQGVFNYKDKYETFTIKLSENLEIVVAAKSNNVTDSFLAKLRNTKLTDKCFPILIITYDTIDTIISGTANMAAAGMPFNASMIMDDLETQIGKAQLSLVDQIILEGELKIKETDRFNDKSSLYEYQDILNALGKGKIEADDYSSFSLFPDPEISAWVDKKKISERLVDNRNTYEQIDRIYRRGNVKEKLEKDFDKDFVNKVADKKKKSLPWQEGYTYAMVQASKDKLRRKTDNPLVIDNNGIEVFSGSRLEYAFILDENVFIRDNGTTKAASRKKNLLIYNIDNKTEITVAIATNIFIKKADITEENLIAETSAREINLKLEPKDGCFFAKSTIKDSVNGITYEMKICVINTPKTYLDAVKTSYLLYVSEKRHNSQIQVVGLEDTLIINPGQEKVLCETVVEDSFEYVCNYDETLTLRIDKDRINADTGRLNFKIKCGGTQIPIQLQDEPMKPVVLTGIAAFKKRFLEKKSLEYKADTSKEKIICGTQEFFPKENREYLNLEKLLVDNAWLAAEKNITGICEKKLLIPSNIETAYKDLVAELKRENTVPSLAYYKNNLLETAQKYVEEVETYLSEVQSGVNLTNEQNDLLLLGCIVDRTDGRLIKMSPLQPLNVMYQLRLLEEQGVGEVRDVLVERLTPLYLIPYLYDEDKILFHAVEQKDAPEWRIYAPFADKRYQGTRNFVQKLVNEKITGYKEYFSFLFEDIGNREMFINLVNMGDCREVFGGLVAFYVKSLKADGITSAARFVINIYVDDVVSNVFNLLSDYKKLKEYILSGFVKEKDDIDVNDVVQVLINNVQCYYRKMAEHNYHYAHITFYEMAVSEDSRHGQVDNINSGISLDGIVSGMPSVLNADWYKTGFGMKYAPKNRITQMAQIYNAMYLVANSGSSFDPNICIFTEIEKNQELLREKIYKSSNWVVFVDPKVDLTFFQKGNQGDDELMIIHYSDQYTSSNGYDDITVTQKSEQYNEIICEQLAKKGVQANREDVNNIISLFNAINGSWMLRLITTKKLTGAADSNFSREKMSILSAIKLTMSYYKHPSIVWVPISLEEMLRVSGGAGYSQKEGLLSARNLGFATQATSDDILLVGLEEVDSQIRIYIHPIEVKIGQNPQGVLDKAKEQVINTYNGLWNALWPDENKDSLEAKMSRNFFIQLIIVCCEKMDLYNVYPEIAWDKVTDSWRKDLLNENYVFSHELDDIIGKGTIVSFKADVLNENGLLEDGVCTLHYPEKKGSSYMVLSADQIASEINMVKEQLPARLVDLYEVSLMPEVSTTIHEDAVEKEMLEDTVGNENAYDECQTSSDGFDTSDMRVESEIMEEEKGIHVLFGTDVSNGNEIVWRPNDTEQVFHTNTGIIGTMGTGKTQFTKSLIAQLYRNQNNNIGGKYLGILIFDYKGDYNESKTDFVETTNATILKPYQLPFNPLALTKSKVKKPLLPLHTANAFKDTISKVYGLGPKQEEVLLECMLEAYTRSGIVPPVEATWDNEAPTFDQVYQIYANDEDIKKGDSLAAAMNKLQRFQIFEPNPSNTKSLFDILNGVVVIDLSGYDSDIQSLIVAITLDLFYSQMQASGSSSLDGQYRQLTKFILVDEADNFMSEGFDALKKILKEGREFGVGTILSTQFLKHFGTDDDDYSKYILTWVVHNVADLKPSDVDFVFKTESKSPQSARLFNDIKGLKKHHSIIKIGNNNPMYIQDKAFWELIQE